MKDEQSMSHLKLVAVNGFKKDRLSDMLAMQKKINAPYFDPNKLNIDEKVQWSWRICWAIISELTEFMNWLPWKWWSKKKRIVDAAVRNEIRFELIDIFHFLNTLCLLWGMDASDIHQYYVTKSKENLDRQKRGY